MARGALGVVLAMRPLHESAVEIAAEPGVTFFDVQDVCPLDPVGHIGLAPDPSVLPMVTNALDPAHPQPVVCGTGQPY
jgi:hypothetical protein